VSARDWSPSEAVLAFASWLTCRDEPTVMGATENASPAVERLKEFCQRHGLEEPRPGWEKHVVPEFRGVAN
jgi:hypothetical protein